MSIDLSKMSKLGFGLMRLPQLNGEIDHEQVCRMVDAYMAAGLNYFDTAYVYHGGKSEVEVRSAIVERYPRDSFYLATKLPAWSIKKPEDRDRILAEQMERAGVDYFDFYLLHSLENGHHVSVYEDMDCFNWCLKKKEEGKIRHFGFSFHGTAELLVEVLDRHPEVEFVQIQLNYLDWSNPVVDAGRIYSILRQRNIPMIIMEPVKGGRLAEVTPEIEAKFRAANPEASVASWALRFAASLPGVMTVLSGMSNEEQMADNLKTFSPFRPLSEEEMALVKEVAAEMMNTPLIGCTACRYCTDGCPMHINIPEIFKAMNTMRLFPKENRPHSFYANMTAGGGKAGDCIGCGQCEGVCPQHLEIIQLLAQASELLDQQN